MNFVCGLVLLSWVSVASDMAACAPTGCLDWVGYLRCTQRRGAARPKTNATLVSARKGWEVRALHVAL